MEKSRIKRVIWLDVVRVIAIYLVLTTHSFHFFENSTNVTLTGILNLAGFAIVKTCVPLFVMLSGALLLGNVGSYLNFYKRRFARLLPPWIFWTAVSTVIILADIGNHNDIPGTIRSTFLSFWFLPMIASLYLLTPFVRLFLQKAKAKDVFLLILLWFLSLSVLPFFNNSLAFPLHTDNGLVRQVTLYSGYFLLGYLLLKIRLNQKTVVCSIVLALISITWIVSSTVSESLKSGGDLILTNFEYISPGIIILTAVFFILIKKTVTYFETSMNRYTKTVIEKVSKAVLGIYFIHGIVIKFLQNAELKYPYNFGVVFDPFINSLVIFVISLLIILVLQNIKGLKNIIS